MASFSLLTLVRQFLPVIQSPATRRLPSLLLPLNIPYAFRPRRLPKLLHPLAITSFSNLSDFLSTLWDSFLLAVPKKRSSYSKKRSRQLAGKGLKDLTNLNHCSSCGRVKRMHILCPYCVAGIKDLWAGRLTKGTKTGTKESKSTSLTLWKKK